AELAARLPLRGFPLYLAEVAAALGLALVVFYFACRLFRVEELEQALGAIGGRLRRAKPDASFTARP
ncbi:MAG TPA: hypothetical protein VGA73_15635, partial [Candidatus Binatia bacterium]